MVEIFYRYKFVGEVVYFTNDIYGVGKRPDATFWGTHRAKICL